MSTKYYNIKERSSLDNLPILEIAQRLRLYNPKTDKYTITGTLTRSYYDTEDQYLFKQGIQIYVARFYYSRTLEEINNNETLKSRIILPDFLIEEGCINTEDIFVELYIIDQGVTSKTMIDSKVTSKNILTMLVEELMPYHMPNCKTTGINHQMTVVEEYINFVVPTASGSKLYSYTAATVKWITYYLGNGDPLYPIGINKVVELYGKEIEWLPIQRLLAFDEVTCEEPVENPIEHLPAFQETAKEFGGIENV